MNKKTVYPIFFSPTGTTQTIIRAIGRGTGLPVAEEEIDLTLSTPEPGQFAEDDLVIIGLPVYAGRLPALAVERFQALKGNNTRVVAVVVYGNRAYEDALLELSDCCTAQGFKVVSAGAFVGQHSYSSDEFPTAANRPDAADLQQADRFGRRIQRQLSEKVPFEIPGNHPYKPGMQPTGGATETELAECTHCGACAEHCPTQCIRMEDGIPKTTAENCIWCMACIQHCPTDARKIVLPKIHEIAERLHTNCQTRREPECFPALGNG